eukprot:Platyproteum_vivax@DN2909_c0_g1_i1.p1
MHICVVAALCSVFFLEAKGFVNVNILPSILVPPTQHKPGAPNVDVTVAFVLEGGVLPTYTTIKLHAPAGYRFAPDCLTGVEQPTEPSNVVVRIRGYSYPYEAVPLPQSLLSSCGIDAEEVVEAKAAITLTRQLETTTSAKMHSFTVRLLETPWDIPIEPVFTLEYGDGVSMLSSMTMSKIYSFTSNLVLPTGKKGTPIMGKYVAPSLRPTVIVSGGIRTVDLFWRVSSRLHATESMLIDFPNDDFEVDPDSCDKPELSFKLQMCNTLACFDITLAPSRNSSLPQALCKVVNGDLLLTLTQSALRIDYGIYLQLKLNVKKKSLTARASKTRIYTCQTPTCTTPEDYYKSEAHLDYGQTISDVMILGGSSVLSTPVWFLFMLCFNGFNELLLGL